MSHPVILPATSEERLLKIADMHCKEVRGGLTSGLCNECQWVWPCPTYRWATEQGIDANCSWDLSDCAYTEHNKHEPVPE